MNRNKIIPSEHDEQASFFANVLYEFRSRPDFKRKLFFATLNGAWIGGSNRRGKGALLQKYFDEGFTPGVADILYLQPRGNYPYLAIEMKREDRRNELRQGCTSDQEEFLYTAAECGALIKLCFNAMEALDAFRFYMTLPACDARRLE